MFPRGSYDKLTKLKSVLLETIQKTITPPILNPKYIIQVSNIYTIFLCIIQKKILFKISNCEQRNLYSFS
jgi:hypothetical protein